METSSRYDQALFQTLQSTVEQLRKDLKERIQRMEEKFSELQKDLSIRNVNLKNLVQEMIPVGEDDDSRQPAGLADRTQKGNGQRYKDRQTCGGSTMDGKLILHEIV